MRVSAFELPARWGERAATLATVDRMLSEGPRVDLAVLPEASLDGYVSPELDFDLTRFAEPATGSACHALAGLAQKHGCHLAGSFVERVGTRCFNAMAVFGPDGACVARYRKRHPWMPELWATAGTEAPPVVAIAGARVTMAICFDLHFLPTDAASELRAADVLLLPSAWVDDGGGDTRATLLPALARAFDVAVVNANWGPGAPRIPGQGGSRILGRNGMTLAFARAALAGVPTRIETELL